MKALIPHKDTTFLLARIAKNILFEQNSQFPQSAYPRFPLWVFEPDFPLPIQKLVLQAPQRHETELFFPVQALCKDNTIQNYRIVFATLTTAYDNTQAVYTRLSEDFPLEMRVFRIADVVLEKNSWQVFDQKWYKLPKSPPGGTKFSLQ